MHLIDSGPVIVVRLAVLIGRLVIDEWPSPRHGVHKRCEIVSEDSKADTSDQITWGIQVPSHNTTCEKDADCIHQLLTVSSDPIDVSTIKGNNYPRQNDSKPSKIEMPIERQQSAIVMSVVRIRVFSEGRTGDSTAT